MVDQGLIRRIDLDLPAVQVGHAFVQPAYGGQERQAVVPQVRIVDHHEDVLEKAVQQRA